MADFAPQCLEALKSLGKTLGQMTLYKIGHPAVAATLQLAEQHLNEALAQTEGEIVFSIDQDKWLANGRIVAGVTQAPTVLQAFFTRFKIGTISFRSGVTGDELAAFCELAGMRADNPQAADPKGFLASKNVTRIELNEAVYTKVATVQTPVPAAPTPAAPPAAAPLESVPEFKTLDEALRLLVGRAVPDPSTQAMVLDKVMSLLAADIQKRVEEVAKTLVEERNVAKNESARTASVVQNMMEGAIVVDNQGKILMMNPAAEEIYGTSLAEIAGKPLTEKAGEEHMITLASEIDTPKDREIKKDVAVAGPADTTKTIKASGAVVQNEEGKVVGVVAQLPDMAKHKALQKMQRDFVAHVTHELRAPLASIRAALEIMQGMGPKQDDENRMLDTALKNSDRLADMINSILDFSKLESGQMQVFPKQTDAEKIAREAVESLAPWASKKRVGLSLSALPGLPPVSADHKRTVQVIINLLSNAIKFTPVGGHITVKLGPGQGGSGGEKTVEYAVSDTGPGIPKAEQKRVFEKFVQIAAGELHAGGTGLGLSIAKALVHLQGGKMWLESDEGKGATFFFTVPVYVPPRDAAPVTKAPPPAPVPWWKKLLGLK